MPAWSKVLGNGSICRQKTLRMAGRFDPLHPPLPLAGGLMRVLGTVVEVPMLAVLHSRQDLPLCSPITLQFIRNDHSGDILTAFEQLAEKLLRGLLIPAALHQNVEYVAVLIHCPPQVVAFFVNGNAHLIQVPFVTRTRTAPTQCLRIGLAALPAPFADGFVRDDDAADAQEFFYVAVTQREAKIQPDSVADDLPRKPMMFV